MYAIEKVMVNTGRHTKATRKIRKQTAREAGTARGCCGTLNHIAESRGIVKNPRTHRSPVEVVVKAGRN